MTLGALPGCTMGASSRSKSRKASLTSGYNLDRPALRMDPSTLPAFQFAKKQLLVLNYSGNFSLFLLPLCK